MQHKIITERRGRLALALVFGILGALSWRAVDAAPIQLLDLNGVLWEISSSAPTNLQFQAHSPTMANRMTVGTLTDNTEQMNLAPRVITFNQITQAPTEASTMDGLRLLFETNIINATTPATPWTDFELSLIDLPLSQAGNKSLADRAHPPEAHFHTRNGATYSPFNAFIAPGPSIGCPLQGDPPRPVAGDVSCHLRVVDGTNTVAPLGTLAIRNLLLHEREFSLTDFQNAGLNGDPRRSFQLVLRPSIPIPEPSSLFLLASGYLGLLVLGRRRRQGV